MTRTRRIAGGAALGVVNQVVAVVIGLWLTRFVLTHLGQHDYGLWLLGLQVAGYLALADVGVVAILPRQTAFAAGALRAGVDDPSLRNLVGETTRLVLWQTPIVAAAGLLMWLLVPASWSALHAPLAVALAGFVVAFPLRLFPALLQGLQDLAFVAAVQLFGSVLNAALVVALLFANARLFALAIGFTAAQLVPPLLCWWRLRGRFASVLPAALPHLTWPVARQQLTRSTWVSVGQLSGILVNGADLIIVGAVLGPAAVVPYALTGKLVTVFGTLPLLLAHTSGPALSEMRVAETPRALGRATAALTQAVLVVSGAVACVVLAVNQGFVTWWVGAGQYGGLVLTTLFVALMLVQHYGTTVVYTVYSFGHERRLAVIGLAQGVVAVALSLLLVHLFGPAGAVVGSLVAAGAVALPLALPVVARDTGTTTRALLLDLLPWTWRLALLLGVATTAGLVFRPRGVLAVAGVAAFASISYAAVAAPFVLRPPLREYALQVWRAVGERFGRRATPAVTA